MAVWDLTKDLFVSIHAPARGATAKHQTDAPAMIVSIHAPARGATNERDTNKYGMQVSIHAPARGATYHLVMTIRGTGFQSTRPHGARHQHPSVDKNI